MIGLCRFVSGTGREKLRRRLRLIRFIFLLFKKSRICSSWSKTSWLSSFQMNHQKSKSHKYLIIIQVPSKRKTKLMLRAVTQSIMKMFVLWLRFKRSCKFLSARTRSKGTNLSPFWSSMRLKLHPKMMSSNYWHIKIAKMKVASLISDNLVVQKVRVRMVSSMQHFLLSGENKILSSPWVKIIWIS